MYPRLASCLYTLWFSCFSIWRLTIAQNGSTTATPMNTTTTQITPQLAVFRLLSNPNYTASQICAGPLLAPTNSDVHEQLTPTLPCYFRCSNNLPDLYFTVDEQKDIDRTVIACSVLTLLLSVVICVSLFTSVSESEDSRMPKYSCPPNKENMRIAMTRYSMRPFTWDVKWCVTLGYLFVSLVLITPHLGGPAVVVCNTDENTVTKKNPKDGQSFCAINGLTIGVGIQIIGFYTAALGVILFTKLFRPHWTEIEKWKFHAAAGVWILFFVIYQLATDSFGPNVVLGICSGAFTEKTTLLIGTVVPVFIYVVIASGTMVGSVVLLWKHIVYTKQHVNQQDQQATLRRFFYRFLGYGIAVNSGLVAYLAIMMRQYDQWQNYEASIKSATEKFVAYHAMNVALGNPAALVNSPNYDVRLHDIGAGLDSRGPTEIQYILLPIAGLVATVATLIISCTDTHMLCWMEKVETIRKISVFRSESKQNFNGSHVSLEDDADDRPPISPKNVSSNSPVTSLNLSSNTSNDDPRVSKTMSMSSE